MANNITVTLQGVSPTTCEATIRQHRVLIDRPLTKGGSDLGPMGGELFLAAIAGCFMSNLLAAVRARNEVITCITTQITGTIEDAPARFTAIELQISAKQFGEETLNHLVRIADRGCIMMNTLREQLPLTIRVGTDHRD